MPTPLPPPPPDPSRGFWRELTALLPAAGTAALLERVFTACERGVMR